MKVGTPHPEARRIAIVGGGFSGACLAVQLTRGSPNPLHITIIEPRAEIGRGLAYSTTDPDHRLNAPAFGHSMLPDDFLHFVRWTETRRLLEADPKALRDDGAAYFRRHDYGSYVADTLAQHAIWPATGSMIEHLQDIATRCDPASAGQRIHTASGGVLDVDMLFIATGNPLPRLPSPISRDWAIHPRVVENPFEPGRLGAVAPNAEVLVLGTGLTALDAMSTLLVQGHRGRITAISRRGLRPRSQGPTPPVLRQNRDPESNSDRPPGPMFLDRVMGRVPDFLDPAGGVPASLSAWVRALRARIKIVECEGGSWQQPFDNLRDTVWQLWPRLPLSEQRRFLARLRPWYDVHRFRSPPQNEALVAAAADRGQIRYLPARLLGLSADQRLTVELQPVGSAVSQKVDVDIFVNCSGLDTASGLAANPLVNSMSAAGTLQFDACRIGLKVDADGRAIGLDGQPSKSLRVVGPPTLGAFGDPIGAFFIAAQIHRFVPAALNDLLESAAAA